MSKYESEEEERADREKKLLEQIRVMRSQLPFLLERFKRIPDPRNPKTLKHQLAVVLLTGMFLFVYQSSSRREANRDFSRPLFLANLQALLPELESLPHHDTVERLLSLIEVDDLEKTHLELFRRFLRKKKFARYLFVHCTPLAFDGSQKMCSYDPKSDEWQHRTVGKGEDAKQQYYVYVLQASLCFRNGMVLPLLAGFLSLPEGDVAKAKQDCERSAAAAEGLLSSGEASEGRISLSTISAVARRTLCQWPGHGALPELWLAIHDCAAGSCHEVGVGGIPKPPPSRRRKEPA